MQEVTILWIKCLVNASWNPLKGLQVCLWESTLQLWHRWEFWFYNNFVILSATAISECWRIFIFQSTSLRMLLSDSSKLTGRSNLGLIWIWTIETFLFIKVQPVQQIFPIKDIIWSLNPIFCWHQGDNWVHLALPCHSYIQCTIFSVINYYPEWIYMDEIFSLFI